jgi:hypothetical protein
MAQVVRSMPVVQTVLFALMVLVALMVPLA